MDFATRCAQPGVVKCVGFDTVADFSTGSGGTNGAYSFNSGIMPPSGTSDYSRAVPDTTVKASGASSLRFTVPANSSADTSGAYFTNFSTDLATQFDAGQEFFVQWRQRFSPEYLADYAGGGGFKQIIIGTGDQAGTPKTIFSSCSSLEVVLHNHYQKGFPTIYNSCSGSASHGPYDPLLEPFGQYDYKEQNARPAPYCLYSQQYTSYYAPVGNCFGYYANEWMTFQIQLKLGPRVADEFQNSTISLWMAREGKASELVAQFTYNLSAGAAADKERFGKIWLLPYNTGKDASKTYPVAYTWYDELIISSKKIADPL